ncbi:MAG: plasmid mobilization relaxosome protein MobC [Chitinophagaceae bacterium]
MKALIEKNNNRNRWLHLRLTETEYKKIHTGFAESTKRKISDYARSVLLDKPITIYTRNKSYDDFIQEMIVLRKELNAIGNNFNQTVKKLHKIVHDNEIKSWALVNEKSKEMFLKKVDEIKSKISQVADQWSQE